MSLCRWKSNVAVSMPMSSDHAGAEPLQDSGGKFSALVQNGSRMKNDAIRIMGAVVTLCVCFATLDVFCQGRTHEVM